MDIVNYTYEQEQLVVQSALRKRQTIQYETDMNQKHFHLRKSSIYDYFQKMSCYNKKYVILEFVIKLRSPANTFQILSNMSLSHIKTHSYSQVDPVTNSVQYKQTWDHNRMLGSHALSETLKADLEWFDTLEDEKQFQLVMTLLESCSLTLRTTLYMPLFRIYCSTMKDFLKTHSNSKGSVETLKADETNFDLLEDDPEFDPKHPMSVEVYKQRKRWFDLIESYKEDIYLSEQESLSKNIDKEPAKRAKRENSSKGLLVIDCDIDIIQLLPVWIVKKIFCYLNNEELHKVMKVNSYWAFVGQEVVKEKETRTQLNEILSNLKQSIDYSLIDVKKKDGKSGICKKKIKCKPHYEFVAIDERLVPTRLKKPCQSSLETEARDARSDEIYYANGEMVPFPRLIRKGLELNRYRPCSLQDVNVRVNIDKDIEEQRSFMMYSLDRSLYSVKISVDDVLLEDW